MADYDEAEDAPLDPAAERLRRKMVRLLVASGGIMTLGLIAVFAALVYKLGLTGGAAGPGGAGPALDAAISIPQGARLLAAELDGDRALLRLETAAGGTELLLLDLPSGAVIGRYSVRPD